MTYKKFKDNIPVIVFIFGILGSLLGLASWYIDNQVENKTKELIFKTNQINTRLHSIIMHDPKLRVIYKDPIPLIAPTGSDELPVPLSPLPESGQ